MIGKDSRIGPRSRPAPEPESEGEHDVPLQPFHLSRARARHHRGRPVRDGPTQPRARPARVRGGRRAARHGLALLRQADQDAVQRHPGLLPDVGAAARLPRRRPLPDASRASTSRRSRPAASTSPGKRLECRATTRRGHAVPAHAAAAQRLLPVAPAPGRDRGASRSPPERTSSASVRRPDAAGRGRRRDLHGRRAGRRRPAGHGEGADDARGPVRGRAGRGRGRARARRRRARTTSRRSPTARPSPPTRCSRARARGRCSSPRRASRTSSSSAARRAPTSTGCARRTRRRSCRPSAASARTSG